MFGMSMRSVDGIVGKFHLTLAGSAGNCIGNTNTTAKRRLTQIGELFHYLSIILLVDKVTII